MRLKKVVLIAVATAGGGLVLILILGLAVPSSVLQKLSHDKSAATITKTVVVTENGKQVVKTVTVPASSDAANGSDQTGSAGGSSSDSSSSPSSTGGSSTGSTGGTGTGTGTGTGSGGGTGTGGGTGGGGGAPPPTSIGSFSASPASVAYQGSSTLAWSSSNATGCSISPGIGSVATSGSHGTGALSSSTTYTLSCSGNGTVSKQASVSVAAPPPVCGQAGGTCSTAQVAGHNSQSDCWMIYGGKWYVVTSYVNSHPGGRSSFNAQTCGVDVTAYMNGSASTNGQRHAHSTSAYSTLKSFTGGNVQ